MHSVRNIALCGFAIAGVGSAVLLASSPGFGTLRKKSIALQTRQPAVIRLANTTIAFKGSSTNREYASVEGSLLATLETELVSNEKTLVKKENPADAEWVLDLQVTGFATPNPQNRTENSGKTATTYTRWVGSINAAYQVLDHSGRVHDANNVSSNYDQEFNATQGRGGLTIPLLGKKKQPEKVPHTTEDVKQILVNQVVKQIAANLGNTTKTVEVEIAGGDEHLDHAAEFVDQHLWQRAIDELQGTKAFAKPTDDSYRLYDLGLAYESMAYDSKTGSDQRTSMYKAAEFYDKALELNPKEKYFVQSISRTKDAIARYKELDRMQEEDAKVKSGAVKAAELPQKIIRIGDVVTMFTAGVPEDQIIDAIHESPVEFNPRDMDTMIAIAKAKLPVTIQNEMRQKVGAPLLASKPK